MILRKQRAVVYESKAKEENSPPLEERNELNTSEVKMPIKASINKTSQENEKSFQTEDENTQNEKLSLKLDSVKRISKFFEKDLSKIVDLPNIDNKVDENVHTKRWDINPSSVFKEKLKTYQCLVQNTDHKMVFKKKNSEAILSISSEEKRLRPEIVSDLSQTMTISSVEINEKSDSKKEKEKEKEKSILKQEETTSVIDSEVNGNLKSDISIISVLYKKEEIVKPKNEFKEKLKTYQALLQSSEGEKQKKIKTKNSVTADTNNLSDKKIENSEVIQSHSQLNQLPVVEIDENEITVTTEDKEKPTIVKQEKTTTVPTLNNLQEIDKPDKSNNITTIVANNKQPEKESNDTNDSNDFKIKLRVYQMLVQNSEEKKRNEVKTKNNKTTKSNNWTDEKIKSSSNSKVHHPSIEISEETEAIIKEKSLKNEVTIASATTDVPVNENVIGSSNISDIPSDSKMLDKDANPFNDSTINQDYDDNDAKPLYQNALQKDKPLLKSSGSSVKLIISQYQTSIQGNVQISGEEKNKPALNKHISEPKILVSTIHEDISNPEEIEKEEFLEEIKNSSNKTKGINYISNELQSDLEKSNNNLPSESASAKIKKEVKFLKERKYTVEKLPEPENSKIHNKVEKTNPKTEKQIQKQEPEMMFSASEEKREEVQSESFVKSEYQSKSSIKDLIKKARLEAERQEQKIKENQNRKSVNKVPVINNKSPVQSKLDLNEELKKTFKLRSFNNEIVSNDNFDEETNNPKKDIEKSKINKDQGNISKSSKVFKYKIGQKSEEEVITDWTPVKEVIIKSEAEVEDEKKENKNSKPLNKFNDSELEEITYKNTRLNAKTTTELKNIYKLNKPQTNSLKENSQRESTKQNGHYTENSEDGDDNNNNKANLEKFISKHLEKQMQNNNTVEVSKQPSSKSAKHGATRIKPTNRPAASEYFKNTDSKIVPNGTIVNSHSEQDYPEPDYD